MTAIASRRKRTIIAAIFADPYRKLAAIALALGLWYFLNDQITRDETVTMALIAGPSGFANSNVNVLQVRLGNDKVVGTGFSVQGSEVRTVDITFLGQSADIDIVKRGNLQLVVDFSNRITNWEGTTYVDIEASDIQLPGHLQGLDLEMDPPRVRLGVDIQDKYAIPLRLDQVELQIDDELNRRLQRKTAKFLPDTASVLGPAENIKALRRKMDRGEMVFEATITGNPNDRDVRAVVRLRSDSGLTFETDPLMTILIEPRTEKFDLELPLVVDDLALVPGLRGQYRPVPDEQYKRVSINAGGELLSQLTIKKEEGQQALDEWAKAHLRLIVWIQSLDAAISRESQLTREASLILLGPLQSRVDGSDYSLADTEPITLRRRQ